MEVYNNCVSITHARKRRRKSIRRTRLGNRNVWARPIVLTRARSATAGESELRFHFILHNSSFRFSVRRPAVGSSDWLGASYPSRSLLLKALNQRLRKRTRCQPSACLCHHIVVPRPCCQSVCGTDDLAGKRARKECRINEPRNDAVGVPIGVTIADAKTAGEECLLQSLPPV